MTFRDIVRAVVEQERPPEGDIDDPTRLADEARAQIEKHVVDLRAAALPIETEPPTPFKA